MKKNVLINAFSVLFVLLASIVSMAKPTLEKIEYKDGDTVLEGFIAYDKSKLKPGAKRPGIVLVHDWMGVSDYVKMRAEQYAEMGYVAFVADIYGKGTRPKDAKEAGALAGQFKAGDRKLLRSRAKAAFDELLKNKYVEGSKVSAAGYCFGGTTALEMARMGLPLKGAISFHGNFAEDKNSDTQNIKTKLLILHGAIDPFVSAKEIETFKTDLDKGKVDYQFISYSNAVHAFTQKGAGDDPSKGAAYQEAADKRSFSAAREFLREVNL